MMKKRADWVRGPRNGTFYSLVFSLKGNADTDLACLGTSICQVPHETTAWKYQYRHIYLFDLFRRPHCLY